MIYDGAMEAQVICLRQDATVILYCCPELDVVFGRCCFVFIILGELSRGLCFDDVLTTLILTLQWIDDQRVGGLVLMHALLFRCKLSRELTRFCGFLSF